MMQRLFLYLDEEEWIGAQLASLRETVAAAVLRGRETVHVCLSGGRTPEPVYRNLAADTFLQESAGKLELHFWVGDERDMPLGHKDRNDTMIAAALSGILPVSRFHPWPAGGSDSACRAYGEELRAALGPEPIFDFTFLGMGADGHTAGIFNPDYELAQGGRLAHPSESPLYPRSRMTLAPWVLRNSARIVVGLRGEDKKKALEAALEDRSSPIGYVAGEQGTFYYLQS